MLCKVKQSLNFDGIWTSVLRGEGMKFGRGIMLQWFERFFFRSLNKLQKEKERNPKILDTADVLYKREAQHN